ncbi:MAG: hypothetical protein JST26_11920 [Bacteroidetes bacterium]|nr:hypothetical protein [Bacteroidota bacterium]
MKFRYILFVLLFSMACLLKAQDRIFFRDGKMVHGKILSIAENTISYKDTLNMEVVKTVSKKEVLLAEYKNGTMFIFGDNQETPSVIAQDETRAQRKERKLREWKEHEATLPDNILGFYLPELGLGRFTVSYERLLANKSVGIMIPASLTYNMFPFSSSSYDSTTTAYNAKRGINFITGLDLNFYTDIRPGLKYIVGPRFRYGTDMSVSGFIGGPGGTTGYTAQIQNGFMKTKGDRFVSSFTVGVGFFKFTEPYGSVNIGRVYPWASINWRLGFRL